MVYQWWWMIGYLTGGCVVCDISWHYVVCSRDNSSDDYYSRVGVYRDTVTYCSLFCLFCSRVTFDVNYQMFGYSCASYTECNLLLIVSVYFLCLWLSRFMCVSISFCVVRLWLSVCLSSAVSVFMGFLTWIKRIDWLIDWYERIGCIRRYWLLC